MYFTIKVPLTKHNCEWFVEQIFKYIQNKKCDKVLYPFKDQHMQRDPHLYKLQSFLTSLMYFSI